MHASKRIAVSFIGGAILVGTGIAYAASGDFVRGPGSVVFYYSHSSGNADGNKVTGKSKIRQCLDAPGSKAKVQFVSEIRRHRAILADPVLQTTSAYYSDAKKTTSYVTTDSSLKYYPNVTWNYTSASGPDANGYGEFC
ncbi:hypothetical protein [Tessaracoccus caeni]|uniref:hypothetical protein n=1 Tax=Tessaracoccus caeni TaxID=3031239 RepID=UPI0023DA14BC|nr:hypothetical protein [Tessaracoccus caeni]MDF1486822.1 hypothetical protein [Tessaracoccus caeni]